ncbi:hypothetical protein B0J17DRAFT_158869 [Rhizoctonia solani]|nr:hypothetical protein B0J17DRAFT_158869 [Rhizoctonia solani]
MSRTVPLPQRTLRIVEDNEVVVVRGGTSVERSVAQAVPAPPRKQARTTKNNRSKKNKEISIPGSLKLPIELFVEIMHYLRPVDILKASRTCKLLRGLLMRRSSENIWKRAAENLPYHLPPPPPWLNMPQYVSVVYTRDCSSCSGKAVPRKRTYESEFQPVLFVRLCVDCQPSVLIPFSEIPRHLEALVAITHVDIFSERSIGMDSGQYALRGEVQKLGIQYDAIKKLTDKDGFNEWERAKIEAIKDHSKRAHWDLVKSIQHDRERQRKEIKHQFQLDVERRLTKLGWYDIGEFEGKGWKPLTRQARSMTNRSKSMHHIAGTSLVS